MLGVDFAAGNRVSHAKMMERMSNALHKASKITAMMKGGCFTMNLMKSHVLSAVRYSARMIGMLDDIIDKTRSAIRAGTSTRAFGGSAKLDLMLQKSKYVNPMFDATVSP